MAETASINAIMTKLMNLRQEWIANGYSNAVADRLREEIRTASPTLDIHRMFIETLESQLNQGIVPVTVERKRFAYPVRNQCSDIVGHVKCFREHNDLVHGGIIYTPEYALHCSAYRMETLCRVQQSETRAAAVGGHCYMVDQSGNIASEWDTTYLLPWDTPTVSFGRFSIPDRLVIREYGSWRGFYFPNGWHEGVSEPADTGSPMEEGYFWCGNPAGREAVENPYFNAPHDATPGFVISTPYLKVFHPDCRMKHVMVFIAAARFLFGRNYWSPGDQWKRHAQWVCETFPNSIWW